VVFQGCQALSVFGNIFVLVLYLHTLCSLILQFMVSVHLLSPPTIIDESLTLPIV